MRLTGSPRWRAGLKINQKQKGNNMRNQELLAFICETIKVRGQMGDMACLTLIQSALEAQRPCLIAPPKRCEEEAKRACVEWVQGLDVPQTLTHELRDSIAEEVKGISTQEETKWE
jgi:hypothetical protein